MHRSTINKYLCCCFLIVLTGNCMKRNENIKEIKKLIVTSLKVEPISAYEPAKIWYAHQYTILEHLYSPLITISNDGELSSGLAESFNWVGNEAHFKMRSDLKSSSGDRITAQDAANSLKRLFIIENTHGDISSLLCGDKKISKLSDSCEGIDVDLKNNILILKLKKKVPFIFYILANTDYSVIPTSAFDEKTFEIRDYSNTTGPYYYSGTKDKLILKANPNYYNFNKAAPQELEFVEVSKSGQSLDLLLAQKIDVITTDDNTPSGQLIQAAESNNNFEKHETLKIKSYTLVVTKQGSKNFKADELYFVGNILRKEFNKTLVSKLGIVPTSQFYPVFGEGGLSKEQENNLDQLFLNSKKNPTKKIKIGISKKRKEYYQELYNANLENIIEFVFIDGIPVGELEDTLDIDAFLVEIDTGYKEDVSLISYSVNSGCMDLKKDERAKWLEKFVNTEDKTERIKDLRELHYKSLVRPHVIPLAVAPYVAIARKGLKLNFSQFYSNSQLWRVREE